MIKAGSHLKIIILQNLCSGDRTGYDLMAVIKESCNWKPSPGSVYPALNELLKQGFVTVKKHGKKKIYKVTRKGVSQVQQLSKQREQFVEKAKKEVQIFTNITGVDNRDLMNFLDKFKKADMPFKHCGKEMLEFRKLFFKVMSSELSERQEKKLKIILTRTIKDLGAL